ncbi:hypothetical protein HDU87_006047 [Geranomyces variabilis]|uniref:Uncharacterized protein n=1 Tax=Geranomyces variabilis TaxID=109894 RepID=A0AAD5TSJ2_9FUNG|nr:hypothetical protein HDU87_006047 [Geranomyces variabilis]
MAWFSERPPTALLHGPGRRRQHPGEHEKEAELPVNIWVAAEVGPPVSTFTSDYCEKPLSSHNSRKNVIKDTPPKRPHPASLWVLRGEEELKRRGGHLEVNIFGNDGILPTAKVPGQFKTTHERDFQIPGFDQSLSGVKQVKQILEPETGAPAGLHTVKNDSVVQYSSPDLINLLSSAKEQREAREEFGRRSTFAPRFEDHHRSGLETFSDYKERSHEPPLTRGEDFKRRQDIIGRTVKAGTTCLAGK